VQKLYEATFSTTLNQTIDNWAEEPQEGAGETVHRERFDRLHHRYQGLVAFAEQLTAIGSMVPAAVEREMRELERSLLGMEKFSGIT
jgi:hypothetical protein